MNYRSKLNIALLTMTLLAISACGFPGVYKIDVQQGNVVTQQMIDQLRPGLTKRQVQFIMGTPLIQNTFNQARWDYIYNLQPGGEALQQESVSLYFDNGRLSYFTGDFIPTEATVK